MALRDSSDPSEAKTDVPISPARDHQMPGYWPCGVEYLLCRSIAASGRSLKCVDRFGLLYLTGPMSLDLLTLPFESGVWKSVLTSRSLDVSSPPPQEARALSAVSGNKRVSNGFFFLFVDSFIDNHHFDDVHSGFTG